MRPLTWLHNNYVSTASAKHLNNHQTHFSITSCHPNSCNRDAINMLVEKAQTKALVVVNIINIAAHTTCKAIPVESRKCPLPHKCRHQTIYLHPQLETTAQKRHTQPSLKKSFCRWALPLSSACLRVAIAPHGGWRGCRGRGGGCLPCARHACYLYYDFPRFSPQVHYYPMKPPSRPKDTSYLLDEATNHPFE